MCPSVEDMTLKLLPPPVWIASSCKNDFRSPSKFCSLKLCFSPLH
jgi:hypothetical protein